MPTRACVAVSQTSWFLLLPSVALLPRAPSCARCAYRPLLVTAEDSLACSMSSQSVDVLFVRALDAAPSELTLALKAAGLDDPGILESYPRSNYDELVAAGITGLDTAACGTDGGYGFTGTGDTGTSAGTIYLWGILFSIFFFIAYPSCVSSLCCPLFPPFSFSRVWFPRCARFQWARHQFLKHSCKLKVLGSVPSGGLMCAA